MEVSLTLFHYQEAFKSQLLKWSWPGPYSSSSSFPEEIQSISLAVVPGSACYCIYRKGSFPCSRLYISDWRKNINHFQYYYSFFLLCKRGRDLLLLPFTGTPFSIDLYFAPLRNIINLSIFSIFWQIFRRCNIGTLKSNSCFMLTTKFNLETEKSHPRSSIEIFSSCLCAFFSLSASGSTCLFASSLLFISYSGISALLYHFLKGKL